MCLHFAAACAASRDTAGSALAPHGGTPGGGWCQQGWSDRWMLQDWARWHTTAGWGATHPSPAWPPLPPSAAGAAPAGCCPPACGAAAWSAPPAAGTRWACRQAGRAGRGHALRKFSATSEQKRAFLSAILEPRSPTQATPAHPRTHPPQRQRQALHRLLLRRGEGEAAVGPLLRLKLPLTGLPGPEPAGAAAATAAAAAAAAANFSRHSRVPTPSPRSQTASQRAQPARFARQGARQAALGLSRRPHLKPFATHSMPCPTSFLPASSSGCGPRNRSNTAPAKGRG